MMLAVVRFTKEGFHCWPSAPLSRAYLRDSHRHLFFVEAQIEVHHNEREIEFHDFLDFCRGQFQGGDMGAKSCETMASELLQQITRQWPGRFVEVSIFEDGEVGAIVQSSPVPQ